MPIPSDFETGSWQIHNRLCDKCGLHYVQDEMHVLFYALQASCLEICYLRRRFAEQFADFTGRIYIGNTDAFYLDSLSAE